MMNSTTLWNPLRDLETLQDRLLRAMNGQTSKHVPERQVPLASSQWTPSVDISEDANEYLIKAELPEVSKEDVKLTVENDVLTIKGERRFEPETDQKKYHRIERGYGSFTRVFALPEDADSERVVAEFRNGLLTVHLPKSEAKKPRQIEVLVN